MSGRPPPGSRPTEPLVFGHTLDSLYNGVLASRMTPELRASLRQVGLDLSRPLLPAYPLQVVSACMELTARQLHADLPLEVALRHLGEAQVDAFARTSVGRAAFSFMRMVGVRRSLGQLTRSWRNANNFVQARCREVAPNTFEMWINEVGGQPECIQGILSRLLDHITRPPHRVTLLHYDGHACTYLLELGPPPG